MFKCRSRVANNVNVQRCNLIYINICVHFFLLFKTLFQHNCAHRNTLVCVNRMQFNSSYTTCTKNLVHGLLKKKKRICSLVFHLLKVYVKDPPSNAAKTNSKNLEKETFCLSLKNNVYCTVKVCKTGTTEHCCNVLMPFYQV